MHLLGSYTVSGSTEASISFSSIPQTYTDLVVEYFARINEGSRDYTVLYVNGDTTQANYSYAWMAHYDGSSTTQNKGTSSNGMFGACSAYSPSGATPANAIGVGEFYLPNYALTDRYKSGGVRGWATGNSVNYMVTQFAGLWKSNSAITSLTLKPSTGSWVQNSSFRLYGIR
jgi:hypothetical protein